MAGNTDRVVWRMPFKSQEFVRGPELLHNGGRASLRLDYETPTGSYAWTTVRFSGVSAVKFTVWLSCTREQLAPYDRFVEVAPSEWLDALSNLPAGTHHYRVFFDALGCYEIAAEELMVDDDRDELGE